MEIILFNRCCSGGYNHWTRIIKFCKVNNVEHTPRVIRSMTSKGHALQDKHNITKDDIRIIIGDVPFDTSEYTQMEQYIKDVYINTKGIKEVENG